ncbi:hypothetical protein GCM10023221_35080 [Luteimicrobium xylanilyticum]
MEPADDTVPRVPPLFVASWSDPVAFARPDFSALFAVAEAVGVDVGVGSLLGVGVAAGLAEGDDGAAATSSAAAAGAPARGADGVPRSLAAQPTPTTVVRTTAPPTIVATRR